MFFANSFDPDQAPTKGLIVFMIFFLKKLILKKTAANKILCKITQHAKLTRVLTGKVMNNSRIFQGHRVSPKAFKDY